jgi:hypothetical protein
VGFDGTASGAVNHEPSIVADVEGFALRVAGRWIGRWSGSLGDLDDASKRRGIADGDVGQDLAIDLDVGRLEAGDEAPVGQAVRAGRGVDPDDPEAPEVALPLLAVAGRVGEGVEEA